MEYGEFINKRIKDEGAVCGYVFGPEYFEELKAKFGIEDTTMEMATREADAIMGVPYIVDKKLGNIVETIYDPDEWKERIKDVE